MLAALLAVIVSLLIAQVFVDGILQAPFADLTVSIFENAFQLDSGRAISLYHRLFRDNKVLLLAVGFFAMLLLFIFVAITRITRRFDLVSKGIDQVIQESEAPIELPPELIVMENQLNTAKATLRERKMAALQSEQRKNDLVVYLAHDIKTPLTSVIGYLTLLQEAKDMPEAQRDKYTDIALQKAFRLEELINEFFEITRFNLQDILLEYSTFDLGMLLEQLTDAFYPTLEAKQVTCSVQVEDGLLIQGDGNKLARVFNNVLKNAVTYSYANSVIDIVALRLPGNQVEITFRNQGKVIPPHKLTTIFEKFYRLDESRSSDTGGAGLGLAIAKEIVDKHHGTITVRSNEEATTFSIRLPGAITAAPPPPASAPSSGPSSGSAPSVTPADAPSET